MRLFRQLQFHCTLGLIYALFGSACQAAVVAFDISGHISFVRDPYGYFPGVVAGVSAFAGSFSYDTSLPGEYRHDNRAFVYTAAAPSAPLGIVLETEAYQFASNPDHILEFFVVNDYPSSSHSVDQFFPISSDVVGYEGTLESIHIAFTDITTTALTDWSLPETLDLTDWETFPYGGRVVFRGINGQPDQSNIDFAIESLTQRTVPEPAGQSLWTAVALLSGVSSRRATWAASWQRAREPRSLGLRQVSRLQKLPRCR
jgi:hypothetical protein